MPTVEHYYNKRTGITWGVNPGTPEHARMIASPNEFERVEPEPAPKAKRKSRKSANNPHPGGSDEFAPAESEAD